MQKMVANGNTQRRDAELMTRAVKCQLPGGKIANQSDAKKREKKETEKWATTASSRIFDPCRSNGKFAVTAKRAEVSWASGND